MYDKDYNDLIFQIRGAKGEAPDIDEIITDSKDWRNSELGQEILEFANIETDFIPVEDANIINITSDRPDLTEIVIEAVNNKVGRSANMLKSLSQDFYEYYDNVKISVRNKGGGTYDNFLRSPDGAQGDVLWSQSLAKNTMLGMGSYLELEPRSYAEMFGGVENLTNDRLYGTELEVEYELFDGSQSLGTVTEPFHVYRWVDAIGEGNAFGEKNAAAVFHEKAVDGLSGFKPKKEVDLFVPSSVQTNFAWIDSPDFKSENLSKNKVLFEYNPDFSNVEPNKVLQKPITIEVNQGDNQGKLI